VEVRKRFRSIDDPTDILVMIVVRERPGVTEDDLTPGAFKRLRALQQWMPILNYADGYGFTYGARTTYSGLAGRDTRLSIPLSWGGERRAAAELERTFESGPLSVVRGSLFVNRRVNPHYEQSDVRLGVRLGAEKALDAVAARRRGRPRRTRGLRRRGRRAHSAAGAHVTVDTRIDPSFPRNAVFTQLGWERVAFPRARRPRAARRARVRRAVRLAGARAARAGGARTRRCRRRNSRCSAAARRVRGYRAGNRAATAWRRVRRTTRAAHVAAQLRTLRRERASWTRHRVVGGGSGCRISRGTAGSAAACSLAPPCSRSTSTWPGPSMATRGPTSRSACRF
jgi:hypothetical protein